MAGDLLRPDESVRALMGLAMIIIEVKNVMLSPGGMYLPLEAAGAIFLGGMIKWLADVPPGAAS